jgi:hypothetical protein
MGNWLVPRPGDEIEPFSAQLLIKPLAVLARDPRHRLFEPLELGLSQRPDLGVLRHGALRVASGFMGSSPG